MKNFLKLITLIFLTLLAFNKNSFSCDNLKNVKVVCCEYNHWLGNNAKLTVPYDENF